MKPHKGSALLMVLCICAVLMIAVTGSWYTASLVHDASCVRQQAFQRKQSVQGLLTYATQLVRRDFQQVYDAQQPTIIYQGPWPCGDGSTYTGYAVGYQEHARLAICATLNHADKQVASAKALISRAQPVMHEQSQQAIQQAADDRNGCFVLIEQWSINETTGQTNEPDESC